MQPSACTCQCCASLLFACVSLKEPRPNLDVPASEVCFLCCLLVSKRHALQA
ncbi:BQ5605_C017g08483 [Microbotryum silenes-dioicae]|uniref:BQ5605_C017g08483 protein n=1 Tax=Microbotryum silenes-dioicae TaxID=796604 RepID=A0A2X0NZ20_9BASI|nr:BQ5605_C017g08483 [Microbotryum silenes-dioicae]